MQIRFSFGCLLLFVACWSFSPSLAQPFSPLDSTFYETLTYRSVGPSRGGRVTAVTGMPSKPFTFLFGATGGGVWRTDDAGTTWHNISDGFIPCGSIGAVEVSTADPNVMYVGTGSASPRGNVSIGYGLYRSTDGGASWQAAGLEKGGQIGKIVIHPQQPEWVYAAVLGNPFGPSPDRGVFRSKDGGRNWQKVLFLADTVGAIDLVMEPGNPRVLYAGMWRAERKSWDMIDGGRVGGLYKSIDGGDTWKKVEGGLPTGLVGRIGVAVSPANPKRLWVIQEAKEETKGGLYRSDDGGKTWARVNRDHDLRQRAWYYSRVFADPKDENTVYVLNTGFYKSIDGGKTFTNIPTLHGDNHGLWLNPDNPQVMIQSNDGGAHVSLNGGKTWSTINNQPTSELYRLTIDNQFPYRLYAAQQDNTTISVPSRTEGQLSTLQTWFEVGGGESGHIAVDPRNPNLVYAGNYIGQIDRVDRAAGHSRNVVAYPQMHDGVAPSDIRYRFQWNAPIRLSPHNPDVLYHTSQYVHRSNDGGQTWETISPDLTTNNPAYLRLPGRPIQHDHTGVELYCTIFAFEEHPKQAGELWAGTDDGRVHISRDNGKSWQEITPKAIPKDGTVNMIELSAHAPGRALIAVHKYRENNFRPYIFLTEDYGKNWKLLTSGTNGIPNHHFVRVVREDPVRKGLLFAGTEFGLYVSFNAGETWQKFQQNLPITPITDMAIHQGDLVVATQGRSFWILDDLTPLRHAKAEHKNQTVALYPPRTAYRTQLRNLRDYEAPDPAPNGALLHFYLPDLPLLDTVSVSIVDGSGKVLRRFANKPLKGDGKLSLKKGMNRLEWNLRESAPNVIETAQFSLAYVTGAAVPPGNYTVRLKVGTITQEQTLTIQKDPRWQHISDADLQEQYAFTKRVQAQLETCHRAIRQLRTVREQTKEIANKAVANGFPKALQEQADALGKKLSALEEILIQYRSESGQDPINYPPRLDDQFAYLHSAANFQDARPGKGFYDRLSDLEKELNPHLQTLNSLFSNELAQFEAALKAANVPYVLKE